MDYRITLHKAWRTGRQLIHPGNYRVPEDMPDELAQRALAQASATIEWKKEDVQEPQSTEQKPETETEDESETEERAKGTAPQNKARGKAPKNKASLG